MNYVDYDKLGKTGQFTSAAGQYIGLTRGHINTWVNFGEEELYLSIRPKRFQGVREIPYKEIADVTAKRHMNLYFIIMICCLTIISCVSTQFWGLLIVALLVWAGLGSEIKITLNSGSNVLIYSASGVSDSEEFRTMLMEIVGRAKRGEVVAAPENTTGDSAMDLFVMKEDGMEDKTRECWDTMMKWLHSGQTAQQLATAMCAQQDKGNNFASAQVNQTLYQEACNILKPTLLEGEQVLLCLDNTLIGKLKNFAACTNQRIIFYYDSKAHPIYYKNIYRLSCVYGGIWYVNGMASDTNNDITCATLSSEQRGLMLATICKICELQMEPGHKIIVCDNSY